MAARKAKRKSVSKRPAAKKAGSKVVKKDIRSLKKGLRKEIALTRKVSSRARALSSRSKGHDRELGLLRKEVELLKKRKKRQGLSAYQKFMRAQIRGGKTFKQAAVLWNRQKRAAAKKNKKRTPYNVFVSMQLKQGKTMKQAIRAWNVLKNPPRKRRAVKKAAIARARPKALKKPAKSKRRVKRKKTVKRKRSVKRKKTVKRKRFVKGKTIVKRRVVRRMAVGRRRPVATGNPVVAFPEEKIARAVESVMQRIQSRKIELSEAAAQAASAGAPCDEELALKMIDLYFGEVARYGFKRKLSLDEVVNAYFYCLMRVQRKSAEMDAVKEMIVRKKE